MSAWLRGTGVGDADEKIKTRALVRVRPQDDFATGVFVSVEVFRDTFERLGIAPPRPHANELDLSRPGRNERGGENGQKEKQTHGRTLSPRTTRDKFFAAPQFS